MKPFPITLKRRFAIIVYAVLLLVIIMFITSLNQFRKISRFEDLRDNSELLVNSRHTIDSLQNVMFSVIPGDIMFYKTGRHNIIESIKNNNQQFIVSAEGISRSFFVNSNRKISTKVFLIKSEFNRYNQNLDKYVELLKEKGFDKYGLNGKIDLLAENILETSTKAGLVNVFQSVKTIQELKNEYLIKREPALINRVSIENNEAKAFALLADRGQKLALLTKLQKLEELINQLSQFDLAIGLTTYDGLLGKLKKSKDKITVDSLELKSLVDNEVEKALFWAYIWLTLTFISILISLLVLYVSLQCRLQRPLQKLTRFLTEMVKGKLPDPIHFKSNDEIATMTNHLNTIVSGLQKKADFAIEIGKGKLDSHYQPLSEDDILGNALLEMEKSLQKADQEDQKYKDEEKKRIWANEGLAKFAEILRMHNNDINKLSDEIIQNLVIYLNASQGALYFVTDEDDSDPGLELVSAYAYDRKKHIKQKIQFGEGLIGSAAIEKERIFVTDIPENFLNITSGLGDAPPRSILIVPFKLEDEVLGIMELTSFSIFTNHEIGFVEKIGETIASTITSVKVNARTSRLLEQSQKQAEEMAEQEEEMRQNMEELRTTQEDFARREAEIQGLLNAIRISTMVMILDSSGKVVEVNEKLLNTLLAKEDDIVGRNHKELLAQSQNTAEYEKFWDNLKMGNSSFTIEKVRLSTGKDVYLRQTFTPILDKKSLLQKVLIVSNDITESKTNENLLKAKSDDFDKIKLRLDQLSDALDSSLVRCEYSAEGRVTEANELYCKIVGRARNEIVGKVNTLFLKEDEKDQFERIWNEVINNKPYTGSLKRTKPTGEDTWLMASFIPIVNEEGNISKIYLVAQDITERRLKYQLLEEANKEIERLKKEQTKE